ncbi:MAG: DUF5686 and carboxypeptidase regulatory-like domain-containing protein [Saprospiraceae bacterium]
MKRLHLFTISLVFLLTSFSFQVSAQSISGYVYNMDNEPIPYANIFVRELGSGTTTDENGYYYLQFTVGGEFQIAISSLGYETLDQMIVVKDENMKKSFFLKTSAFALEEVTVRASKRDPAYAIIQNAIDNKKKYLRAINSYKTEVYLKAVEEVDKKNKKKKKKKVEEVEPEPDKADGINISGGEPTPQLTEAQKANRALMGKLNLVELQLTLNYQYPKKYKEERTAYKKSGDQNGLFIPKFGETDFNFYRNMVRFTGIAETPIISPLSNTSVLSYKFKLIESKAEGNQLVHKIKVIPRKSGNSTVNGYIYINDGLWNINRVDFKLTKSGLKFFDAFNLKQNYEQLEDSIWIVNRQEFTYETKVGRFQAFRGSTTLRYTDFQKDYEFPAKFFKNEVVVTTKEAYERDSSYWNAIRPEALTVEQQKVIFLRDSISAILNSKEYQDSITAEFNKITFLEVFWEGVGWRNNEKKSELYVGSIPSLIDFSVVGGFRGGPFAYYFRRFENGQMMSLSGRLSYGFRNQDLNGFFNSWYRYNPHKLADLRVRYGRRFQSVNSFDAFFNQLSIANYIQNDEYEVDHRFEIVNGLYLATNFSYNDRKSIEDYLGQTQLEEWLSNSELTTNEVLIFDPYQAFITNTRLQFTPGQKYMTEPNRKIILGSDYPTFTLRHRRGWENVFGSDVNFDYLEFQVDQDLLLGQFGHLLYNARIGDFLNNKKIQEVDVKRFRASDPIWYSNPLYSFQLLDTSINTTNLFFEVHGVHHFNGAFVNNIPLVKKTGVRLVAGAGFMWLQENNFRHQEVMLGLERVFKLGARRRLKVGLFGVAADGNHTKPDVTYKVSIDVIDTWKKDWSF